MAMAGGAQVSAETELNWNTVKVVQPKRPRKSQQTEESIRKVLQHCFTINGAPPCWPAVRVHGAGFATQPTASLVMEACLQTAMHDSQVQACAHITQTFVWTIACPARRLG